MSRKAWVTVAIVVAAGAALLGWRSLRSGGAPVAYRTEPLQRGDVRVQVSATGTLEAVITVQVGSQISGTIQKLSADFNDHVRSGQVLAQLDPTFLKAQVAQNEADLWRAEVEVRQAERDSARIFPLERQDLVSQAELDAARTKLDAARASRAAAAAALLRARTNLQYATITSPIDGVVVSRDVDVGQTVAASLQAPTLYTIANDLRRMQLEVAVDEADIGMVQPGQEASFTVDAHPERIFRGVVHQIRLAPVTIQNVVTYTVVILVDNPDEKLLPGMTANVSILVDEEKDVLRVPAMALRFRPPGAPAGATAGSAAGGAASAVATGGAARTSGPGGMGGSSGGRRGQGGMGGMGGMGGQGGGGGGDGAGRRAGVVHILPEGATQPRPLPVRIGLSDGTFTAVRGDSLVEGMRIVIASDQPGAAARSQETVNPFAPRFPGGRR